MKAINESTKMEAMRVKLSTLWLFATLNYIAMFVGTRPTLYYVFFGTLEMACTALIVWYAWRWPKQEAHIESIPLRQLEAR